MFDDERDEPRDENLEGGAEEPAAEEPAAPAEEPAAPAEEPVAEELAAEEPAAPAEEPAAPSEEPVAEEPAAPAEEPVAEGEAAPRERPKRKKDEKPDEPEVIPGAHLEPDIVFEEQRPREEDEFARYAEEEEPGEEAAAAEEAAPAPVAATPLDLAADARYRATGKRKTSVARVILKPGDGTYSVNGKPLDVYFPRQTLQVSVRGPLDAAGYSTRMDVVAKIHGGGVAAQAGALRHGVARALVEADPNLRGEMKRRGFLTRDARVKERKKAGLKKARKRPQFSKR
jgi:small subunit ribosomal protein S9